MALEHMLDYLAARKYGYLLFQRLFGTEPSSELLDAIDADIAADAFALVLGDDGAECAAPMLDRLRGRDRDTTALAEEYTRLFVGPAALPAPPWESVYVTKKRIVMQPCTLEVRNAYRAHGFVPARYPHVPDDHVALELDFLEALASSALDAYERDNEELYFESIEGSRLFIAEHLGTWVDGFACDMMEKGRSEFYSCTARTLAAFVAADAAKLEECGAGA